MRHFLRWWETLGRPERIVALSLGFAAPVAIANSAIWAIAVAYMTHQRAQVEIERLRVRAAELAGDPTAHDALARAADPWRAADQTPSAVSTTGHAH